MLKTKFKLASYLIFTIILTLGLSISLQALLAAWTAPTAIPPGDNTEEPINVGSEGQVKGGALDIVGSFSVDWNGLGHATLFVNSGANRVGIGTDDPQATLHVVGNTNLGGDLTIAGSISDPDGQSVIDNAASINGDLYISGDIIPEIGRTVDGYDISEVGQYFIDSAGTADYFWKSDGDGAGVWSPVTLPSEDDPQVRDVYGGEFCHGTPDKFVDCDVSTADINYWILADGNVYRPSGNVGIGLSTPSQSLHVNGNIRTDGRHIYFGGSQEIYGDGSSAIYYDGIHDTVTQMIFRDAQKTIYGRVYGAGDGQYFGLLDGDGNWSYLTQKDAYTQLMINNAPIMTLLSGGNVGIGITAPGVKLDVGGTVRATSFLYSSDESLKKNIKAIPDALDKILMLKGVEFDWKENERHDIGLVAQDTEKVFPELVDTDKNSGLKSIEYGNLVAPLIEAIKLQQKQINSLKAEIELLKSK